MKLPTWKRIVCRVRGHVWKVHRVNMSRVAALAHLHTVAGCEATCLRCGEEWDDFNPSGLPLKKGWPPAAPAGASDSEGVGDA